MGMKLFRLRMRKEPQSSSSSPSSSGSPSHLAPPSPRSSAPAGAAAFDGQRTPSLLRLFDDFDADGDGRISHADLECLLRRLSAGGATSTTDPAGVAASMVHAADSDGDGFISLEEFASVCGGGGEELARRGEELRSAFEVYDRDGDGVISAEELQQVLSGVMGEEGAAAPTLAECRSMIRAVDRSGDGTVSFEEFERMMTRSSPAPMGPEQPPL